MDKLKCILKYKAVLDFLPSGWQEGLAEAICMAIDTKTSVDCTLVQMCQSETSLSDFFMDGEQICLTYIDENQVSITRCFTISQVINETLNNLDPKCLADNEDWVLMNYAEKVQTMVDRVCTDCEDIVTTTTTTTITTSTTTTTSSTTTTTTEAPSVNISYDFTELQDANAKLHIEDAVGNVLVDTLEDESGALFTNTEDLNIDVITINLTNEYDTLEYSLEVYNVTDDIIVISILSNTELSNITFTPEAGKEYIITAIVDGILLGNTTTTTTTTITSTTTTTTLLYEMCVDCGLELENTVDGNFALSAGALVSTLGCTVGAYVIDWYLGEATGTPAFTSGSSAGADPDVTVVHPFLDEPVEGGIWYPVIRSVVINGNTYTYEGGINRYSPDLFECLDPITVVPLSCTTGTSVSGNYSHTITYTNTVNNSTLATRSVRFNLDGQPYVAWQFEGQQVPDTLKITYISPTNSTSTIMEHVRVGLDLVNYNYTSDPMDMDANLVKSVIDLTGITFTAGDYLRFEVIPNINSNTNWKLYMKCLATFECSTCNAAAIREYDPESIQMVWDATNCRYVASYERLAVCDYELWQSTHDFAKYLYISRENYGNSNSGISSTVNIYLPRVQFASTITNVSQTSTLCASQVGQTLWSKSGNVVTGVFANTTDYEAYKTQYVTANSFSNMQNYSTDDTVANHFKLYALMIKFASSCGDTYSTKVFYTHITSPLVFDDTNKTITMTLTNTTNNVPVDDSCDTRKASVTARMNLIDQSIALADFTDTPTNVRLGNAAIAGQWVQFGITAPTENTVATIDGMIYPNEICDLDALGFSTGFPTYSAALQSRRVFVYNYEKVTITNSADPINNWKLERLVNPDGTFNVNPANYILMYQIVNGVVTYPSTTTTTTL